MIEFTKEEINLCKQVAERHKKPLKNFDLVVGTYLSGEEFIGYFHEELLKEKLMKARLDEVMVGFCETAKTTTPMIPLWTISDCLGFLREKMWHIVALTDDAVFDEKFQYHCEITDDKFDKTIYKKGKTPLEVCLKAVLAVLKGDKS